MCHRVIGARCASTERRAWTEFTRELVFGWGLEKYVLRQDEGRSFLAEGAACAKIGS